MPASGKSKKERERERERTGSARFVACLITALHERYALAARMKRAHMHVRVRLRMLPFKSHGTLLFLIFGLLVVDDRVSHTLLYNTITV